MVSSVILGLKSAQADITTAFVHAELTPEKQVFAHQPRGFTYRDKTQPGCDFALHLKRALYGLKQAPRHFFQYLTKHLEAHNLRIRKEGSA